ncbi:hypothetical protein V8C34DRAFT_272036 [Trichoderma compactum]
MLCSHKKANHFFSLREAGSLATVIHSLVKIVFLLYLAAHRGSDTRHKKKEHIFFAILPGYHRAVKWKSRMAVSGIPRTEEPVEFLSQSFWCISERRSSLRTPESPCSLFGICYGGHGVLPTKVPVQHVDVW